MKAIALTGVSSTEIIDVDADARAAEGEVVVHMRGLGLCGSDLSRFLAHRVVPEYPWIIGHEGFGVITEVGADVDGSRIGEAVVIEPIIGCGTCPRCMGGSSALCARRRVVGMTEPGVAREFIALPSSHVHAVPAEWSIAVLGCVEPLAVAVKAVERAEVPQDADVLVIGGGAQGLFIAMLLKARGIRVSVSEINERKAAFVASRGIALADPRGPIHDRVFEASGSAGGWKSAMASTADGGAIVLVGMGTAPLEFTSEDLVLRQIRILTSYVYDHPQGFRGAIEAISSGAIDVEGIVSAVVDASDVQSGHERALEAAGKIVLSFDEWSRT